MPMPPIALILAAFAVGQADPSGGLVKPGAAVERLWGEGSFTEGGAWDGRALLFSDIGDRIMRFDPATRRVTTWREPSGRANGMLFDREGRLVVAEGANTGGGRRVSITGRDGKVRTLADRFGGRRFNSPNDLAIDRAGRAYVSDPRYVGDEPRELDFEGVFRIDPDGSVHRVETSAKKPNGLAVASDGRTLYVADNGPGRRALLAVDLDRAGDVSRPRVLVDGVGVDGLTVTTDGKIVATVGGPSAGVRVFDPVGRPLGVIPVPEVPANVEFGGPDRSTLYIMAGRGLYRVETTMRGFAMSGPEAVEGARTIAVPLQDNGYQHVSSVVIGSASDLDALLARVGPKPGWNDFAGLESALRDARVDFRTSAIVLIRHDEGSATTGVTFDTKPGRDKTLVCRIAREPAGIGLTVMSYRCLALAVDRAEVERVEVRVEAAGDAPREVLEVR